MIAANELRIGNWIMIDNKERPPYPYMVAGGHDIEEIEGYGEDCFPIPLTPEILGKAGFIYNSEVDWFELRDWLPFVVKRGRSALRDELYRLTTFKVDWNIAEFEYVHQLQNLYFALTGTELNIEL